MDILEINLSIWKSATASQRRPSGRNNREKMLHSKGSQPNDVQPIALRLKRF